MLPRNRRRLLGWLLISILAVVAMIVVIPIGEVYSRLSRNGATARQLAEGLKARFAGVEVQGRPSYESEVVYITIQSDLAMERRREVEQWLREQKTNHHIAPEIWLRFDDGEFHRVQTEEADQKESR